MTKTLGVCRGSAWSPRATPILREDAVEKLVSTALHFYAKAYTQEAVEYLLDHLNCKSHYILQDIDHDLEDRGGYQLQFTSINGTPYPIYEFTLKKYGKYSIYELVTKTRLLHSEQLSEKNHGIHRNSPRINRGNTTEQYNL